MSVDNILETEKLFYILKQLEQENPDKKFRTGSVSELLVLDLHVLRLWTKEFKYFFKTSKSSGGQTLYSFKDLFVLLRIKHFIMEEKYSLSGVKNKLKIQNREPKKINIQIMYDLKDKIKILSNNISIFLDELKKDINIV